MAAPASTGTRWPPFPTRVARVLHPSRRGRPLLPRPSGLWGLPGLPRPAPAFPHRLARGLGAAVAARPLRDRRASALAGERTRTPPPPRGQASWARPGSKAPGLALRTPPARGAGPHRGRSLLRHRGSQALRTLGDARFCAGDSDIGLLSPSLKWES